jgi:cardiolipin synthase
MALYPRTLTLPRWPRLWLCFLVATAGCHASPSLVAAEDHAPSRKGALARQLVSDTVIQAAHRPLRSGRALLSESADFLHAAGYAAVAWCRTPPAPALCGTLDGVALEADLRRATGTDLQPADIRLFLDGAEALTALEQLIDQATQRIEVLMFLWDDDAVGWAVAKHLAARAGPDLPVRVLVDGGGNLIFGQPPGAPPAAVNRAVCWLARQPFVQVLRTRDGCARFDHRKMVLVDGRAAWLGGRNFTARAFFSYHDLSFILEGPLAGDLAARFEQSWREQCGAPQAACGLARTPPDPPAATNLARLVSTGPADRALAEAVYAAVDRARDHVFLENPYCGDRRLIAKLCAARQRGVDVRAVLTLDSDSAIYNRTIRVTADRLLRAGARVYLYPGMTHVKALTADGCWAYTGSGNFDPLSLRHDRELGVAIGAGPVIAELEERLFQADCHPEWELHEPLPVTVHDRTLEWLTGLLL